MFIILSCGTRALVSSEDYERVVVYSWSKRKSGNNCYAVTEINGRRVSMHQFILGNPGGIIDHKDKNGLNNRRRNLRKCSNAENLRNQRKHKDGKNDYKGIEFDNRKNRWRAIIKCDGKKFRGKRFRTQLEAAIDYNRLAKIHHGEFASPNLI